MSSQKDILHQIAKASAAIRKKHRMIKLGKESLEQSLRYKGTGTFMQDYFTEEKKIEGEISEEEEKEEEEENEQSDYRESSFKSNIGSESFEVSHPVTH